MSSRKVPSRRRWKLPYIAFCIFLVAAFAAGKAVHAAGDSVPKSTKKLSTAEKPASPSAEKKVPVLDCKHGIKNTITACNIPDLFRGSSKFAVDVCTCVITSKETSPAEKVKALMQRGRAYDVQREFPLAAKDFSEVIRLDPKYAEAYLRRGIVYSHSSGIAGMPTQLWRRAMADFDTAIRLNPDYARAYFERGTMHSWKAKYDKGEYQKAIKDYDTALRIDPRHSWSYAWRGRAYDKMGQHERAIQDYDAALKINSTYRLAILWRAEAVAALPENLRKKYARPKKMAKKASPESRYFLRDRFLGKSATQKRLPRGTPKKNTSKTASLGKRDAKTPKSAPSTPQTDTRATLALPSGCDIRKDPKVAIPACTAGIRSNTKMAALYLVRGQAYFKANKYAQAIKDYDQTLALNPAKPDAAATLYNRARAYSRLRQFDKALADYQGAIAIAPNSAAFYFGRAELYLQALGKADKAVADLNKATALAPKDTNAFYLRGLAYLKLGRNEPAEHDFSTALILKPDFQLALRDRAKTRSALKQYDGAVKDLSVLLRLNPSYWDGYLKRGTIFLRLNKYGPAIADFDVVLKKFPKSLVTNVNRGLAYAKMGKFDLALNDFDTALRIAPNNKQVMKLKGQVLQLKAARDKNDHKEKQR